MTFFKFRLLLAFLFLSTLISAQTYPIRTSVRLIPPFSGYLPEYGLPGSEKLKVLLLLTDFSKGQYTVKLQFKLEGQGISITTKPGYNPAGIVLDAGVPFELTGELLNSYLAADNLDFNGIDLAVYQKRQTLPEGHYSFCVTAYAYNSPSAIQVSNNACAMAWLMQSDPPRINTPICGSNIKPVTPQQVLFKWLPMGAASPNAAGSTEYELSLYEIRPEGRNPNDVIASSKPVYQTTTDFTTYVYGLEATPLTVGMEYAWRVQAKDKTGKDLIKNGGYSETCTFTYGNKLDEQSLTLSSKTVNYTQAKLSWDSLSPFKPFTLNYRKKGSEFWFEATSDSSIYRLNNLEPATSYEARVKGLQGSYTSNWSNTTSFTTPIDSALSCGTATPVTTPTNTNPLLNATPGMVFKIGRFELTVIKISGGNGTYSGSGSVKVPFLKAALNVRYENIFVNEDKVVTTGEVKVVNDKVSDWVNDNTIGTIHKGQNTVDHVIDFTTNPTNITVNGNSITIKGNNGQSTVIDHTPGTETTIKDAGGNLYVVDKNGQTTQIGTAGNGSGAIAKNLNCLNTKDAAAAFTPVTKQQYGFDALTYPELKLYYEQLSDTATAKKVAISWKSVRSSKTDVIDVTLDIKNKAINSDSIFFITGTGTQYTSTGSGNKRQLRILGGEHGDVQELFAAYRDNKKTVYIGKLNIVSYKPNTKKVVLVPFALKGSLPDAAVVQEELNKIYAQAITGFEVSIANPLTLEAQLWDKDNNGRINAGSDGLSRYSAELKAINSSLRQQSYYDKSSYYILVTSLNADSLSDLQGEMPRGRNIGYSFNTSTDKEKQTLLIAHELGHGAFALEHTFSGNTPISKATTDNLMDYANGKHLHKYQWNYVQQPVVIIGALEDNEDAASKKGTPVITIADKTMKEGDVFIYNEKANDVKVQFATKDAAKTKIAYQLKILVEASNKIISYPKTGFDTLVFNEIKQITLDSIPQGKYTLLCKVGKAEYETYFFIRSKKLILTKAQLKAVFNTDTATLSKVVNIINTYSDAFGLGTTQRMTQFLAQTGYESGGFKEPKGESGCYSKTNENGWEIWYKKSWNEPPFGTDYDKSLNLCVKKNKKLKWTALTCDSANKSCVIVPEEYICTKTNALKGDALSKKLFSYAYQCEGGNGNSASEDGYKYRGHGAIQLTWKKTYQEFDTWLKTTYKDKYKDVMANPKIIDDDKELFILSAMWFWNTNNLNNKADNDNFKKITEVINNNSEGIKAREANLNNLKKQIK